MNWSFWFWSAFAAIDLIFLGAAIEKEKGVLVAFLDFLACLTFAFTNYLRSRA